MKDISGTLVNADAVIIGITASGLWLCTTKYARARMAWKLASIAWRTLWQPHTVVGEISKET